MVDFLPALLAVFRMENEVGTNENIPIGGKDK